MSDLAERTGLSRQAISKYENGDNKPSPDNLRELAKHLEVPETFLMLPLYSEESAQQSAINFRKLSSAIARERSQATIFIQWISGFTAFLNAYVEIPPVKLPSLSIDDFVELKSHEIEEYAQQTRRFFGLGDGPISNLTMLLENNGVLMARLSLAAGMDGLSAWYAGRPIILISNKANYFRSRFDLAHELAHLVLHKALAQDDLERDKGMLKIVEDQAHQFAGAFLLPEKTFVPEIYALDLPELVALKERWGVSMAAILMRLSKLGIINDYQKMRFFAALSANGFKRKEPLDDEKEAEKPKLFTHVAEFLDSKKLLEIKEFIIRSRFPASFVREVVKIPEQVPEAASNVIAFKPRPV